MTKVNIYLYADNLHLLAGISYEKNAYARSAIAREQV